MLVDNAATGHVSVAMLEDASAIRDPSGRPALGIGLASGGGAHFGAMTQKSIGRQIAIVLDDVILGMPVIHSRIDRRAQIAAVFKESELQIIAVVLRSGRLPVDLELASEESLDMVKGD